MTAIDVSNSPPSGARTPLAAKLPLATHIVLQIFPVYACNFRCTYCVLSLPLKKRVNPIANQKFLDLSVFKKCIDDLHDFPDKVKVIRFCGLGEPTLHKHLPEMVAYARDSRRTESIELLTNGSLLSESLSKELVDAGLSKIRISIEGTSSQNYKETTQNYDKFDQIINNISHLYKIRQQCKIYVKIVNSALKSEQDKRLFFTQFQNISDFIAVERLFPSSPLIDYGNIEMNETQNGTPIVETRICPQPFFLMQLHPDGRIEPCCAMENPPFVGQISNQSLASIWNGKELQKFRNLQLNGGGDAHPSCAQCKLYRYNTFPEDVLDNDRERLLQIFPA